MKISTLLHVRRSAATMLAALVLSFSAASLPARAAEPPAQALLDAGKANDALRVLSPQASGNNATAINLLGRAYYQLADWDNAVRYCERATQLEPRNALYQLWLGRAYGEKADAVGALSAYSLARKSVAAFATAHQLDPRNVAIARDLAEYYASAPAIAGGGADKAQALAAEMAGTAPLDALWMRAMNAEHQGRYEEAEHLYQELIRSDHSSAYSQLELARFYRGRKRWDRFQQTVESAMQSRNIRPIDRYDAAEQLLRANRNLPLAAQQIQGYMQSGHLVEEAPLFRAHYLLGEMLLKSGDSAQAVNEYRAALALAANYRPAQDALRRLGQR